MTQNVYGSKEKLGRGSGIFAKKCRESGDKVTKVMSGALATY